MVAICPSKILDRSSSVRTRDQSASSPMCTANTCRSCEFAASLRPSVSGREGPPNVVGLPMSLPTRTLLTCSCCAKLEDVTRICCQASSAKFAASEKERSAITPSKMSCGAPPIDDTVIDQPGVPSATWLDSNDRATSSTANTFTHIAMVNTPGFDNRSSFGEELNTAKLVFDSNAT